MALKYSFILEMVDKASGPAKRARASMERLTGGARRMGAQVSRMAGQVNRGERSLDHFQRRAQRMRRVALGRTFQAAGDSARRMGRGIDRAVAKLRLMERAGNGAKRGLAWMGSKAFNTAKYGLAGLAASGAAAGGYALWDMFSKAGKADEAEAELARFLGSAKAAKTEMEALKKGGHGVNINELLESYVALRKGGIEPTTDKIRAMADEARASKQEFRDIVDAVTSARSGGIAGLDALNISAAPSKGMMQLGYLDKEGKRVTRSIRDNADEIEAALLGIFSERSGGAAAAYGKTFNGVLERFKGHWAKFQHMVADAGIFDKVTGKFDEWATKLDGMAKDGRLQKWAERISYQLEKAWDWGVAFAERTDWGAVATGIGAAVNVLVRIVELIGQATEKYAAYQKQVQIGQLRQIERGWFTADDQKKAAKQERMRLEGDGSANDRLSYRRNPKVGNAPAQAAVTGKVDLNVKVDGPGSARVRNVSTSDSGFALAVNTGRAMRSAA